MLWAKITRWAIAMLVRNPGYAHESNFTPNLLELISPKTLLLLDRGFWNYSFFEQLIEKQSDFISQLKTNS